MALEVWQSFKRTSKWLRFEDDVLTKSQMLQATDDDFETWYAVIDKDTLEQYVYNANATPSATTWKFVKSSSSGWWASLTIDTTDPNYWDATISEWWKNLSFTNQNWDWVLISWISENWETVASKSYVDANAGKIDKIKINDVEQTITNKEVNIPTAVNYDYDNHILTVATWWSNGYRVKATKKDNYYEISNTNLDSGYEWIESIPFTSYVDDELAKKQDKLVSWTNIKTINNQSILEPWDLEITWVNEEFEFIDIDLKDYNYTSTQTQDKYTKTVNLRNWDECAAKAKTKTLIARIQNTWLSEEQQKLNVRNLKFISTVWPRKLVFGWIIDNNIYTAVHTLHISSSTSSTECAITYTIDYRTWGEWWWSLPAWWTTWQALVKKSDTDWDVERKTVGWESTIDVIKVNGITQTITNKEVDIEVPTLSVSDGLAKISNQSDNSFEFSPLQAGLEYTSKINNVTDTNVILASKNYVDENGGKIDKIKVNGTAQTITNKEVDLAVPNVTAGDHSITVNVPDNSKGFWLEQKAGGVEFGGTHADGDFGTVILTDKTYVDNELGKKWNANFSMSEWYYDLSNVNWTSRITFKENTDDFEITFSPTWSWWNTKTIPTKSYVDNAVSTTGNTFLIVKDTTTYNEILSAFNAKKWLLFCNSAVEDGTSYPAVYALKQTDHILLYVHNHPQIIDVWKVSTDNTYEKTREFVLAENQAIKDYVDGKVGVHMEVWAEKWYWTYTENNVTYQVYTKTIHIPALPATAGVTTYPIDVANMKQIISISGVTTDWFVLNAPRQNNQDNIAIYQVSKGSQTFSIEVWKDRSSKSAYVMIVYAKNN